MRTSHEIPIPLTRYGCLLRRKVIERAIKDSKTLSRLRSKTGGRNGIIVIYVQPGFARDYRVKVLLRRLKRLRIIPLDFELEKKGTAGQPHQLVHS